MKIFLIGIITAFSTLLNAQTLQQSNLIAEINGEVITTDEFLERIELNPQFRKNIKRFTPSIKLEFLLTLIAEKLQGQHARAIGLDTTEAIKTAISSIEKLYVRDALFNKEVKSKIIIDEQEYLRGLIRNQTIYNVRYLFSEDSIDIHKQYDVLKRGEQFDRILSERPEADDQKNPILVYYGDLVSNIEDELYKLSSNEFTKPVIGPDGWYIFYVYNTVDNTPETPEEREEQEKTVRKILESELGEKIQSEYYRNFFAAKNIDVDRELFEILFNELNSIFYTKSLKRNPEATTLIHLDAYDVIDLRSNIGAQKLNSNFVQFENDPITLSEFINEIAFNGYKIEKYDKNELRQKLSIDVRIFIERELLAREGYRQNLHKNEEVLKYTSMWSNHYLSQSYVSSIVEELEITDAEAKKYYDKQFNETEFNELVNIIEIFTHELNTAERVLNLANDGEDFKELAKQFNKRIWTQKTDGEYGLFPVHMFGKIGETASKLEINEISDIIKLDDGYSIIKLISRTTQKSEPPSKTFEEVKYTLKRELAMQQKIDELIENTTQIANDSEININFNALNAIEITNINSFAIRVMGFGGKITPVPIVKPFVEWVDGWKSNTKVIP
jgi:parvulin-like peptidyl-prolyl isomerase